MKVNKLTRLNVKRLEREYISFVNRKQKKSSYLSALVQQNNHLFHPFPICLIKKNLFYYLGKLHKVVHLFLFKNKHYSVLLQN